MWQRKTCILSWLSPLKDALRINSQLKAYDQNFRTSRYKKSQKKSTILKISKTYILHNNNAETLLTKYKKKILPSIIRFLSFLHFRWIFQFFRIPMNFFYFCLRLWKFLKVTVTLRTLDMLLSQDLISHTKIVRVTEVTVARL